MIDGVSACCEVKDNEDVDEFRVRGEEEVSVNFEIFFHNNIVSGKVS